MIDLAEGIREVIEVSPEGAPEIIEVSSSRAGRAATVAIGVITTGAPGTNASVTNSGTVGEAVLDFTIPTGENVELRINGGYIQWKTTEAETWNNLIEIADITATIEVGTVTTGAAGTSVTFVNAGSGKDAIFNLSIPKGTTFTPSVSAEGVISFTNDGGLANPSSVDITGPQGIQGEIGPQGPQGTQGPEGAQGVQGIQGPEGAQGPQGIQGPAGTDGIDGRTILSGSVDPTIEGADGDYYINTSTWKIFGPKATAWPAGVDIVGADGVPGADGTNGTNGTDGKTVLGGTVDPTTEGVDGDWYINRISWHIWEKVSGTWTDRGSIRGTDGADGTNGTNGEGVPIGGATGQILAKSSSTDYATEWVDASSGGGGVSLGLVIALS